MTFWTLIHCYWRWVQLRQWTEYSRRRWVVRLSSDYSWTLGLITVNALHVCRCVRVLSAMYSSRSLLWTGSSSRLMQPTLICFRWRARRGIQTFMLFVIHKLYHVYFLYEITHLSCDFVLHVFCVKVRDERRTFTANPGELNLEGLITGDNFFSFSKREF